MYGEELLLVEESCQAIREAAQANGYLDRQLLTVESGFDWNGLFASTQSMSLFAERRLIELRLPTGKPGEAGAKILVESAATLLRPEAYVDVSIMSPLGEQVTVPFDAILDTGKQSWVFVAGENGQFMPRVVTVKLQAGDDVALASGLSGGEKIVTSANFLIDSESRLKAVALGQTGESGKSKAPSCPKAQHWDVPMAMCMPD